MSDEDERRMMIVVTIGVVLVGLYAMIKFLRDGPPPSLTSRESSSPMTTSSSTPMLEERVALLKSPDPVVRQVRQTAAKDLSDMLPQALPQPLRERLSSTNLGDVREAKRDLDALLPGVGSSLDHAMEDENASVRMAAALALGRVVPQVLILKSIKTPKETVRDTMVDALVHFGQYSIPHLVEALKDYCKVRLSYIVTVRVSRSSSMIGT